MKSILDKLGISGRQSGAGTGQLIRRSLFLPMTEYALAGPRHIETYSPYP